MSGESPMDVVATDLLPDVRIITPKRHHDDRGFFSEVWRARTFSTLDEAVVVQENHVLSHVTGTLRGMHFQIGPNAQAKLVRCVRGSILDVAVDIRRGSPTFGRHVAVELSAQNWRQLYIPAGFAHGYCTLEPESEVVYMVTAYFDAAAERGFVWDDPDVAIPWPFAKERLRLSPKDESLPRLAQLPTFFEYPERQ